MQESKKAVSAFAKYIIHTGSAETLTCPCIAFYNERYYEVPVEITFKKEHWLIKVLGDINHVCQSFKTKRNKIEFHAPSSSLTIHDEEGSILLTPLV